MPRPPARPKDNRAAVAAQFGVSAKALRHYEELGLLQPPRSEAGWRCYGEREIERLHIILSLKQLGLPLTKIAELLKGGCADLKALLSVQEIALTERRIETEHALKLIRVAKTRLDEGGRLGAADLAALVRKISPVMVRATPEINALMQRVFTPVQLERMRGGDDDESLAKTTEGWAEIFTDIENMADDCDPVSPKGLDIARRAASLIQVYTRGDRELWNAYARFLTEGMADWKIAKQLSMKKSHWEFLNTAMSELQRRGELQP